MSILLTATGIILLAVLVTDSFLTLLATAVPGPLTRAWSVPLWTLLLELHRRHPAHRLLSLAGPAIVSLTILLWFTVLVLGSWCLFAAQPGSVVESTSGRPATPWETLGFVTTTTTSLGYGQFVPRGPGWTVVATATTLTGTMVLTLSLSYVISVVGAALTRRTTASTIRGMGGDAVDLVASAMAGGAAAALRSNLTTVASQVSQIAHQHRAYPVLQFFHSEREHSSLARSVLDLADATFLASHLDPPDRLDPGVRRVLVSAVGEYRRATHTATGSASVERWARDGEDALLRAAGSLGIEAGPAFRAGLAEYSPQRRELVAICLTDGWTPPAPQALSPPVS